MRLTLLRHAHAEDRHPGGKDFDRRLDAHGLDEAARSAARLVAAKLIPDLILASPAQRTRSTALALLGPAGLVEGQLRFDARIYNATAAQLLALVRETDSAVAHLLVVGHNPGISEVCDALYEDGGFHGLATAQFLSLSFAAGSWSEV